MLRGAGHSAKGGLRQYGRLLPRAPDLLDLKEDAQSAVERRRPTGHQRGLKDFEQFLLSGSEAYGPPHVGHQTLMVHAPERQEGDGHEFANLRLPPSQSSIAW